MATPQAKELIEDGRHLIKAFESGEPASTILSLLEPLEKWQMTEDLLRSSKIGVVVAKIRTSKDPKVVGKASTLVNRWKAAVGKNGKGRAASSAAGDATGKAGPGTPDPARDTTPSTASNGKVKAKGVTLAKTFTAAPEKRTVKEDGIDVNVTGNATRNGCLTLIYNGLCFMSEESPSDILAVAQRVEEAAYSAFKPETSAAYKTKMRVLFMNMKMKENSWLRKDVFAGSIEPSRLVQMTSEELKSPVKREEDKKIEKENMNKAMAAQEEKAISTTMTCGKCKQSRVAYSQAQTRSADEPMTTFCECTVCGHRWKFS